MDVKLRRYYMKRISGGRTIMARLFDFVLFRAFLMVSLFILMFWLSRSLTSAIVISVFLTLAISLGIYCYRQKRTEQLIEKDIKKLREKCLLEKLTFFEKEEFAKYMSLLFGGLTDISINDSGFSARKDGLDIFVFHNHPAVQCGVDDILFLLRDKKLRSLKVVTLSDFSKDAIILCQNTDIKIKLINGSDILLLAEKKGMLPNEAEAQLKAEKEMSQTVVTFSKIKELALNRKKIKGYMICGIAALFWPLLTGFRFYYPIIAAVCFALAIFTHRKSLKAPDTPDIGIS